MRCPICANPLDKSGCCKKCGSCVVAELRSCADAYSKAVTRSVRVAATKVR